MGIPCQNGKNILISDDDDEWFNNISLCLQNIDRVRVISQHARNFALQEFDYKLSTKKLIANLNELK